MELRFTGPNWALIVFVILGSAVVAYLGDVLGFKYGKQRISIFGLRPKYTSQLITAFTGVFISVSVLTIMSLLSDNVRIALFDLDRIRVELSESRGQLEEQRALLQDAVLSLDRTRFELETLKTDRDLLLSEKGKLEIAINSLRDESEELKRDLVVMRSEMIVVQANALLAQGDVSPNTSREAVSEVLETLKKGIRVSVAEKLSEKRLASTAEIPLVFDEQNESEVLLALTDKRERLYVRALAAENVVLGGSVKVRLECGGSELLYPEGSTIYRKLVIPGEGFDAEETLYVFLRELRNRAIRDGLLPDPATRNVGSLEGEEFFEVVERLKAITTPTIVNAVALRDIYTEGPIGIKIELEE